MNTITCAHSTQKYYFQVKFVNLLLTPPQIGTYISFQGNSNSDGIYIIRFYLALFKMNMITWNKIVVHIKDKDIEQS